MGSGSNPTWPTISPKDLKKDSDSQKETGAFNSEVNGYLQQLLSDSNRDPDACQTHIDTVLAALTKDNIGAIELRYGGSVAKHTYVDGLSDIDILAIIDNTELAGKSPAEVLDYFEDYIRSRLKSTDIRRGKLAITIHYSDGCILQILPTLKTSSGIKIASTDPNKWSNIVRPDKFASKLTEINQKNTNGVVPAIKLFKSINAEQAEQNQLTGYHIESLAIEAFSNYTGPKTRKAMLMHLTKYATTAVLNPIKDSTGQSVHVDDYLGAANSIERQKVSIALKRLSNRMDIAETERSIELWKDIIN